MFFAHDTGPRLCLNFIFLARTLVASLGMVYGVEAHVSLMAEAQRPSFMPCFMSLFKTLFVLI